MRLSPEFFAEEYQAVANEIERDLAKVDFGQGTRRILEAEAARCRARVNQARRRAVTEPQWDASGPAAHAEGPWRIEGAFDAEVAVTIVSAGGFDICEVYPLTGEWSAEDIANAHVLKAAPQLLATLKDELTTMPYRAAAARILEVLAIAEGKA